MAKDRGKEFEKLFEKATNKLVGSVDIQRLYDVVGKKTIEQPADYICYKFPNIIYVECKSTHNTSFGYFNQPQYERLLKKSKINGVKAGMLVWFVNQKRIFWLDILFLSSFYISTGIKSITTRKIDNYINNNIDGVYEITQVTKRINPEMDLEGLYENITRRSL